MSDKKITNYNRNNIRNTLSVDEQLFIMKEATLFVVSFLAAMKYLYIFAGQSDDTRLRYTQ